MAKPIKDTPEITGEDARRFRNDLMRSFRKASTVEEKNARETENRVNENCYQLMVSISNGTFR